MVDRVSSDRVGLVTAPDIIAMQYDAFEATTEDRAAKDRGRPGWLIKNVVEHQAEGDNIASLRVEWRGDYVPTWKPQETFPEELISR